LARKLYPTIRQSVLQSFDNCALLSRFEREYRGGWSHPWQARGSMFHRFAARALAQMHSLGETAIPVDAALAILHEVLRQEDVDRVCPKCESRRIRKGVTKMGMRMCLACKHRFETEIMVLPMAEIAELYWVVKKWAHDNEFNIENLADVEERLSAVVEYPHPQGGTVERVVTGKLDTLFLEDTNATVLDWKDMFGMPPPREVSEGGYFQQRLYGLLVMRNYRAVESVTLREFYVRFSEPRETTIWRYQLDDVEAEMSALVERFDRTVEERLYVPSPGKHCGFCPTPQKCPIPASARGRGAITSHEEAALAAATLVVAEKTINQRTLALKAWAENHGPVPVKDAKGARVYGFRPQTKRLRPTVEQIEKLASELGRTPTVAEIKGLYREVVGTKFTDYTPSPRLETEEDERIVAELEESLKMAGAA
jgi:hypothetical protein